MKPSFFKSLGGDRVRLDSLYNTDAFNLLSKVKKRTIDLILVDPPYGTTRLAWDKEVDLKKMWPLFNKVLKEDGIAVVFCNQPFTSKLIMSNLGMFKYQWIWKKPYPTGFLNANYRPMSIYEDIVVFSRLGAGAGSKSNNMRYHPPCLKRVDIKKKNRANSRGAHIHDTSNVGKNNCLNSEREYTSKFTGYPSNILEYERDSGKFHPTQKPVSLLKFLIETYSEPGSIVLDCFCGSGSTGLACVQSGRRFIMSELNGDFYKIAKSRLKKLRGEEK